MAKTSVTAAIEPLRQAAAPRVLIATSYAPSKAYALEFLAAAVCSLQAGAGCENGVLLVDDGGTVPRETLPADWDVVTITEPPNPEWGSGGGAYARMREVTRKRFLEGDWTHIYWHDVDMIPPPDTIAKLLRHGAAAVTGIANLRGKRECVLPLSFDASQGWGLCLGGLFGLPDAGGGLYWTASTGMACVLIDRASMEAVPFRDPDLYKENRWNEDARWFADLTEATGWRCLVEPTLSVWHAHSDSTANRVIVGPPKPAAVWLDTPQRVGNRYGEWFQYRPRFDLTVEQMATLGAGYAVGEYPETSVETRPIEEIRQWA